MNKQRVIACVIFAALLVGTLPCVAAAATGPTDLKGVSAGQFKMMLDQRRGDPDLVLLDIRTPAEFDAGHIEGAVLLDYYARDFVDRLKQLDREKTYLIYCRSGNRSGKSLAIFQKLGFHHAYHLETGILGWVQERLPLVH